MPHKRKLVVRDDGDDHDETVTKDEPGEPDDVTSTCWKVYPAGSHDYFYASYTDDDTHTNWKFPFERSSIRKFLGGDPATLPVVNQLGLAQTFSIDYNCRPMIHAVREFALGFNSEGNYCDFRGRKLAFSKDVSRDAFLLPSAGKCGYAEGAYSTFYQERTKMFGMDGKMPKSYSVSRLTGDYKSWARPILTFQALLLGMPSPGQLSATNLVYFCANLSNKAQPSLRPDWADLVHYHLTSEVEKLKNHLEKRRCDIKRGVRFRCSWGTAVIRILMHFGFTEEELSHATKKQRTEGGVPKAGSAGRVTSPNSTIMLDLQVIEEGQGPSIGVEKSAHAASIDGWQALKDRSVESLDDLLGDGDLGKEIENARKKKSCEDHEVPQGSLNDSGNQDSDWDATTLSSRSSRQPVDPGTRESMESENTSGGLVNAQERSSKIECRWTNAKFDEKKKEMLAIIASMEAQNHVAELAEQKQKADVEILKLKNEKRCLQNQLDHTRVDIQAELSRKTECDNKLATLLSEKDKVERERDTTLLVLNALREEKKLLETARDTIQKNLEEEKEKSLCQICFESRKDTICLPCLHFHYCFSCLASHSKRTRTCPTCMMPLNGEVRAHIWK